MLWEPITSQGGSFAVTIITVFATHRIDISKSLYKAKSPTCIPATENYMKGAFRILVAYGTFTWKESTFNLTKHEFSRVNTFFGSAVREGRLTRGYAKARSWILFVAVSRLVRCFNEFYFPTSMAGLLWRLPTGYVRIIVLKVEYHGLRYVYLAHT